MPEIDLETTGNEAPELVSGGKGIKKSMVGEREIDKKAAAIRAKGVLPRTPGARIDGRQWQEWARLLTPEMWSSLALYIYRTFPVIIRQLSDPRNDNNIGIATETIDIEGYIKEFCGGGKYRVDVTDAGKKVTEIRLNIPIHECEPKLDYKEIDLFNKENQSYIQSLKYRGILGEDGKPRPGGGNVQGNNSANASVSGADLMSMFDKMTNMVAAMNREQKEDLRARIAASGDAGLSGQIGAILLEKMKQDSPSTLVSGMSGMLSAAKEIMGERKDNGNMEFLKILLDQQRATTEMMSKHSEQMLTLVKDMNKPKEEGSGILDSVESAMTIMERLDSLRGGGGKRGIADYVIEGIEKVGLPLLSHATRIYEITKLGKAVTPNPEPSTTVASTPRQITGMEAARNAAKAEQGKTPPKPEDQVSAETIATTVEQDQEMIQLQQVLQGTGGILVQYMNDDRSGADLALWVIEGYKKVTYQMIANAGEEKLFKAIREFPELWAQLERFGEPAVKTFVHEFCHYEEFLEDEEGVPEPELEMEPKRGRSKKQ